MKKLLGKITGNRFAGVGIGAGVTAIIQSSSATSVMVIGFVNAGVLTLFQATAVIMGANIGTTITGIIVSLKSLPIGEIAASLSFNVNMCKSPSEIAWEFLNYQEFLRFS